MTRVDPNVAYDALPPLTGELVWSLEPVWEALVQAQSALARFDEACRWSPFAAVLEATVPLVEAQASSAIENIVTTRDDLFSAVVENMPASDPNIVSVLRNHSAFSQALSHTAARPVTAGLAKKVASQLLGIETKYRELPGTYIGGPTRIYTPPADHQVIVSLMDDWQQFVNSDRFDPLVRLAVAHHQFEAIHPFPDGNGRTGRLLNLVLMQQYDLVTRPVLHLSWALRQDLDRYYELLRTTTETGDYTNWLAYFIGAVEKAAERGLTQLVAVKDQRLELEQAHHAAFRGAVPATLAELVGRQPYCKIGHVTSFCSVSRPTAAKWLEALEQLGVVQSLKRGRAKYFVNNRLLEVLTT